MTARRFEGFGDLKTPVDLLGKIRHDFERLRNDPENVYEAFDFFVTAYHMLDWLHPKDDCAREAEERKYPLLQVCSHLANGAKHFEATAKKHVSVKDIAVVEGAFQRGAFQSNAFQVSGLFVQLDGSAAAAFGPSINVVDLARRVLAHWEADARLQQSPAP
jgi:hypothetical protein